MRAELLAIGIFLAVVLTSSLGFAPRSSEIEGSDLRVHTQFKTFHYDMREPVKAEEIKQDAFSALNTIRLCAVGRPLKPYGWIWNRQHGVMLAMVNDPTRMVLLSMGAKKLLVSPANYTNSGMGSRHSIRSEADL